MSKNVGGDRDHGERGEPIADVAGLREPAEEAFTDRVMEGINIQTVIHDSAESQWSMWAGGFREFLELIFDLLGPSRKED